MASKTLTFSIRPRGNPVKKLPEELSLSSTGTSSDLYVQLASSSNTSIHRLRITKGSDGTHIPNSTSLPILDTGLRDGSTIYVKDLGPQISWRLVYILEYLGPLLIHPLLYLLLPRPSPPSFLQSLSCALITLHFLKRELETLFVHRFSSATMPLFNLVKNSFHYWLLAGLNIAVFTYRSSSPAAGPSNPYITWLSVALYVLGELGNLNAHLVLRGLRSSDGSTERGIPHGLGFGTVTCPNYMFEALAWLGIAGVTWSWSTLLFAAVAVGQMGVWAGKREGRYRREFGGKYKKKRWVILPGLW
ncbi:MAG: hypothetical protein LQ338_004917 [Usnochroma carphineum]|nr:MAG: hypothetical protein LQ338_004917 [Usnochroma carphineum]